MHEIRAGVITYNKTAKPEYGNSNKVLSILHKFNFGV